MSREIRRVPPIWEHPKDQRGRYIPLYDNDYDAAAAEWWEDAVLWAKGEHPSQAEYPDTAGECTYYRDYNGMPPDRESYRERAWDEGEATAYQVYETVSEGTPVSPVFPDEASMREWLHEQGYSPVAIEAFVSQQWAPSMLVFNDGRGHVDIGEGIEALGMVDRHR